MVDVGGGGGGVLLAVGGGGGRGLVFCPAMTWPGGGGM